MRIKTNRHPTTDGQLWGWVETPEGDHVLFWSGDLECARAASRAVELDRIGWDKLAADERKHVRHGALGDCELLHRTRKLLGEARAESSDLQQRLTTTREKVKRLEAELRLRLEALGKAE